MATIKVSRRPTLIQRIGLRVLGYSNFYEGANTQARARSYISPRVQDHAETAPAGTRRGMMAISRYLAANLGVVRGIYKDVARYSMIGKFQSQSADAGWREQAEAAVREWEKIPEITGRWDWNQVQCLLDESADRDGDMGYIFLDRPFPQLQLVEGHRIDDTGKNDTVDGVILSKLGRPVAYRVTTGDNSYSDIPAASFGLYFEPDRTSQYRGICALHHGLNMARDISDINTFLKQTIKAESLIALVEKNSGGVANPNDWDTTDNTDTAATGEILERLYGGMIPRLGTDEDLKSFATDRPSPNVESYMEFLIRDIGYGYGFPLEFLWNPKGLTGPGMRFVMAKAQRRIAQRQALKERHARRIYGWVLSKLAKRGTIPPLPEDWWRMTFQRPAALTIDVGREGREDRADVFGGIKTLGKSLAERGVDFDDHLQERIEECRKIMQAAGKPDSEPIPLWMLYNPQSSEMPDQTDNNSPDDGSDGMEQI